jgi:hypothetical protein
VPEDAEPAQVGVCPFDERQGLDIARFGVNEFICGRDDILGGLRRTLGSQQRRFLRNAILDQAPLWWKLAFQLLLANDRGDGLVDTQDLVVTGHDLARSARFALIEQDEILDDIEQSILRQHAVQEDLGVEVPLLLLVISLPFREVLPSAGNRPKLGSVAVADNQHSIVMENLRDHLRRHVVGEIIVEALADVVIDGLELDEYQRQPVDEADDVGPASVMRHAQSLKLHLAHGHEPVVGGRAEVDHAGMIVASFTVGVAPRHRHATLDEFVELLIVLKHRAGVINLRQFLKGVVAGGCGKVGIQSCQRLAQVPFRNRVALTVAAEVAGGAEGFVVPGVGAFPAELIVKIVGEGLLDETVFAVDVGEQAKPSTQLSGRQYRDLYRDISVLPRFAVTILFQLWLWIQPISPPN